MIPLYSPPYRIAFRSQVLEKVYPHARKIGISDIQTRGDQLWHPLLLALTKTESSFRILSACPVSCRIPAERKMRHKRFAFILNGLQRRRARHRERVQHKKGPPAKYHNEL